MEKRSSETTIPPESRILQIHFDDWKWRKATVYDIDDKLELYRVECHMRKPHVILRGNSSRENHDPAVNILGEASVHCLSSRISVKIQDQQFELSSCGAFRRGYKYGSPSAGNARREWRSKNKCGYFDLILIDETTTPIARITLSMWRLHKAAKIEIMSKDVWQANKALEEVILTGLVVMQNRLTMYNATLGASAISTAIVA